MTIIDMLLRVGIDQVIIHTDFILFEIRDGCLVDLKDEDFQVELKTLDVFFGLTNINVSKVTLAMEWVRVVILVTLASWVRNIVFIVFFPWLSFSSCLIISSLFYIFLSFFNSS